MCTKHFLRESWSWSSFFSSSRVEFWKTMTICVARLLGGNLGHGHRLFLSQMVLCPFHRSHWEVCTRNRRVSETKISGFWGPFLSRPLCLLLNALQIWSGSLKQVCLHAYRLPTGQRWGVGVPQQGPERPAHRKCPDRVFPPQDTLSGAAGQGLALGMALRLGLSDGAIIE